MLSGGNATHRVEISLLYLLSRPPVVGNRETLIGALSLGKLFGAKRRNEGNETIDLTNTKREAKVKLTKPPRRPKLQTKTVAPATHQNGKPPTPQNDVFYLRGWGDRGPLFRAAGIPDEVEF